MLLLHGIPGAEKCQECGKRFVNDRLISLMKEFVTDYVEMFDAPYRERITCSADWEKPLEEIIDLERLSHDEAFFNDWMELNAMTPSTIGPKRALHDFFSLYQLLRAKKEYKPDLTMEYILYRIIQLEMDICTDEPELHEQVKKIPEPARSQMMEELLVEAEELKEGDPETWEESIPEIADQLMAYYEDLDKYVLTCFEDGDFFFLDEMDEEEMEGSGFADDFGVNIKGDEATVKIEGNGQNFEFGVPAWELEE